MNYTKHEFKTGDTLYANDLNEMDEQIFENTKSVGEVKDAVSNLTGISFIEPQEDDIPKVFFDEPIPQTKDDAKTKFRYISKTEDFEGYAEFKAQGNSSMTYPKKNITVKMCKDETLEEKMKVDFKGWGKQNKHVYKANWIDLTHSRNIVSARIWSDIVKSRSDYETLPELLRTSPKQGAVDGFPVKVYSQGIYQGRYSLNIPKDAWLANMDKNLDAHCILCGENYQSGCFRALANIDESDWTDEIHETVPTSIKTRWNEIISFVMNSSDDDFKTNLGNYFYVDSLIDYLIFGILSCGLDAFGKNQLYLTYDGMKWIASMYDMDSTWGLWWDGSSFVSSNYNRTEFQDFKDGRGNLLYIRLLELFVDEIKTRWNELKTNVLSVPNLINHFERFIDITPLDLVKEDYASTTGNQKFTGIPLKDTNNIQQIRQFIVERYAYCDKYFDNLGNGEVEPDEPETPDENLLYRLPNATTFDGSNYVDTGVKLFDTEKDFSVYLDFACITNASVTDGAILSSRSESPRAGIVITENRGANGTHGMKFDGCGVLFGHYNATDYQLHEDRHKLVYTLDATNKTESIYLDGTLLQTKTYSAFNTLDKSLLLGCRNTTGTNDWFWSGIMYECKVWNYAMSKEQVESLS